VPGATVEGCTEYKFAGSKYERGETMQPRSLDQLLRVLDRHPALLKEVKENAQAA